MRAQLVLDALPIALLTAIYLAAGSVAVGLLDWPMETHPAVAVKGVGLMFLWLFALLLLASWIMMAVGGAVRLAHRVMGKRPRLSPRDDIRVLFTPSKWLGVLIVLALYVIFIDMFVAFKRALPEVLPFSWDVSFMRLDRALHLGRHPWEWLQPVLGWPAVTDLIDVIYYMWFPIKMLVLVGFVWCTNHVLRTQFYVSFWLVWMVLGTILAYALTSAGPCYFGLVTGLESPYGPLMDYLHRVEGSHGLLAIEVQQKLWADYAHGSRALLMKGISAMPSVHVALPALYTLAGWRVNRNLGIAFAVLTLITFLGSIHLGWHYAVDGYLSLLVVPIIWWISGLVVRKYYGRIGSE